MRGEAAVLRRINGERLMVLAWGRAILLQFAHPLVAAGVYEHSTFRASRAARIARLYHTIAAMLALTFGSESEASRAAASINRIHDRVHGRLDRTAGPLPAGTPYSASDPELLLWVHVTLLDSLPRIYEQLVGPLDPGDRDAYCTEAAGGAVRLGLPRSRCPRTMREVADHVARMERSGILAVTGEAQKMARDLLHPPIAISPWPLGRLYRLVTIGTLPPSVRAAYGFTWSPTDAAALERYTTLTRRVRRAVPAWLARWRAARR